MVFLRIIMLSPIECKGGSATPESVIFGIRAPLICLTIGKHDLQYTKHPDFQEVTILISTHKSPLLLAFKPSSMYGGTGKAFCIAKLKGFVVELVTPSLSSGSANYPWHAGTYLHRR